MNLTLQVLDTTGALVLDLNDPAAGYKGIALPDAERTWDGTEATSPWIDGSIITHQRLTTVRKQLRVRVRGATWPQVEARFEALVAAVEQPRWILAIGREGAVRPWRVIGRADTASPETADMVANRMRVVTISALCQPTATLTGV